MHRRCDLNRFWPLWALILAGDPQCASGRRASRSLVCRCQAGP
jgi:hypothetical protein